MEKRDKVVRKPAKLENITPKDEVLKELGQRLKATRKKQGFSSYEHFAYQMDIARSLYAKYESGRNDMKVSTLIRILQGMGMKLSDFFKGFD
ncbi:helix-turn-helix domain-containing protein [Niabella beijingensis]|uniref:helix-turn-helix domain-containing protein n=1 Tax=Niabella beijingensis TaxID=2872700 RepID=UPI001CBAAF84|nr:helix-turn-helix transcriptional regulator [Niabella beijingensis]MBZ4188977.1 helix-turn-helix domain-containing protein [Niabella beijingensis]